MKLIFAHSAFRQFQRLDKATQKRIDEKLRFYLSQRNPLQFAESLRNLKLGSFRFRIGNYRLLFDVDDNKIIVLKVGHRKDIYK